MNLRSKARKLFGRDNLAENTVVSSKIEQVILDDICKRSTAINDAVEDLPRLPNGDVLDGKVWRKCAEDLWSEFYGLSEPTIRSRDKIDERYRVNRELASKNAKSDTFADVHAKTRGEPMESALALLGALGKLRESYGDELGDAGELANCVADAEDYLDDIDRRLEQLREQRNELHGDPDEIDKTIRNLAAKKRGAQKRLDAAMTVQRSQLGSIADAAAQAVSEAVGAAEGAVEMAQLTKGTQAGPGGTRSIDAALAFAERIHRSSKLQRVLEMLGRIEMSMGTVRRQLRKGGYEEIVDIELGNDLPNVLTAEKMLLMHPAGKLDFFRRYLEGSLTQYETWSLEETKKGPLIFGADGSQSMEGAADEFCRAVTVSALAIAHREHRNAAAIEFGSSGQMREFWFDAKQPFDMGTVADFAEHFFRGGTDINQVMRRAVELIDNEAPFHSADLVIVTDGGDHVTGETIELRDHLRAMGVKIHGIAINSNPTPYLIEVCDNVSSIFDFAGPNDTTDRLAIDIS